MAIITNISAANRTVTDLHGVVHTIVPGGSLSMNDAALPASAYASHLSSGYITVSDVGTIKESGVILTPSYVDQVVQGVIKALPASTTATIFTVSGGPVLILDLFGEVTTVFASGANNFKYSITDTASSTTTDISANADVASTAVGSFITLNTSLGGATLITAGGTGIANNAQVRAPIGSIKVTTSATKTGNLRYQIRYRPLAPGAKVIAI